MFQEQRNKILGTEEKKVEGGYWVDRKKVPLLMHKMYHKYEMGRVPLDNTFAYSIKENVPVHMIVVGRTGRQKTVMLKNLIRGFYKVGYRNLIFEPKKMDMIYGQNRGEGKRLAQFDYNEQNGLEFVSYTPITHLAHCKDTMRKSDMKKTTFFSLDIKQLRSKEMWMSFGMPSKGAELVVQCINQDITNTREISNYVRNSKLMSSTMKTTQQVLENYSDFLNHKKYPPIPLKELWDDKKIVTINFHGKQGSDMNTVIGLVVNQAKQIGQMEKPVTKKLLIFDDLYMYGGAMAYNFAKAEINFAQNEIANCQYNYRSFGIDSIVVVQNLDMGSIHPTIVEGRDEYLITRTGSSEILKNLIPYEAYFLVTNQNEAKGRVLMSNKDQRYFQWIYCKEDRLEFVGFPFDCTIGHPKDPTVG